MATDVVFLPNRTALSRVIKVERRLEHNAKERTARSKTKQSLRMLAVSKVPVPEVMKRSRIVSNNGNEVGTMGVQFASNW